VETGELYIFILKAFNSDGNQMDYKYLEVLAEKEDALMSKMKLSMSEKSVTLAWEPKVEFRDYTFTIYGEPQSCSTS